LAYNQGIAGTEGFKGNPLDTDYVSGVRSNMTTFDERPIKPNFLTQMLTSTGEASTDDDKERVDGRSFIQKLFDKVPTPDDSLSGADMMETDPDKKFLFGEKGLDMLKEQYKKRMEERNNPDFKRVDDRTAFQKSFNIIPTPEDSLSGIETVNMGLPSDATDKEKAETEAALTTGIKTEPKAAPKLDDTSKTQLTTLEQELLNRQNQLQKDRDFDRYMALAQAGLSIMSSDKPTLAGAIGEGGTAGLVAFREAQERYKDGLTDVLNARVKLKGQTKNTFTKKDAISAINTIDSNIAKLMKQDESSYDETTKKIIKDQIADLNFQKTQLLPFSGMTGRIRDMSDSANKS